MALTWPKYGSIRPVTTLSFRVFQGRQQDNPRQPRGVEMMEAQIEELCRQQRK